MCEEAARWVAMFPRSSRVFSWAARAAMPATVEGGHCYWLYHSHGLGAPSEHWLTQLSCQLKLRGGTATCSATHVMVSLSVWGLPLNIRQLGLVGGGSIRAMSICGCAVHCVGGCRWGVGGGGRGGVGWGG